MTALLAFLSLGFATVAQQAVVSGGEYDFGEVLQGQTLTHSFSVRNTADTPLEIERVEASLPGISARFRRQVPPGGEGQVGIEWNTAQAAGAVQATISVITHSSAPQVEFHLKAVVQPPLELLPYPAVFFSAYRDEAPEKSVRIVNHRTSPLRIEGVEYPKDHFEVAVDTIDAGKAYDLRVKVRPGIALGRYVEQIVLTTSQPENLRLRIAANLLVKPDFYAFPEEIDFGAINLEALDRKPELLALLNQTTILENRGSDVAIRSITTDLPFLKVLRSPESGKDRRFRLEIAPIRERMNPGPIEGTIHVLTEDPQIPELIIPVRGRVQ